MSIVFILLLSAYVGAIMLLVLFPDRVTRDENRRVLGGRCLIAGFITILAGIAAAAFLPGLAGTVIALLSFTASATGLMTGLLLTMTGGREPEEI